MADESIFKKACDVWEWEKRSIARLIETVDPVAFENVVRTLVECNRTGKKVLMSGCGTSGTAAAKACKSLCTVDIPAFFVNPSDGTHVTLGIMQPGDVCVLFSKGGNRSEILELMELAKARKIKTIAVTANPASPLALNADVMLLVSVDREADAKNSLATNSTLAMISTFDAVAVTIKDCASSLH